MITADQPTLFPSSVRAVVSSAADGTVKYGVDETDEKVAENLSQLTAKVGLAENQVAGIYITYDSNRTYDVIREVRASDTLDIRDKSTWVLCDALVTTDKHVGLLIPIADCNGVIVYDSVHNVLALAHIGWHAAAADLPAKLVKYLVDKYDSKPGELLVYISPSIRKASYFNDNPVQLHESAWQGYIERSSQGYHMDVFGYVRDQFFASGVMHSNVQASTTDVAQSHHYFSHFREKQNDQIAGRFAVICTLT